VLEAASISVCFSVNSPPIFERPRKPPANLTSFMSTSCIRARSLGIVNPDLAGHFLKNSLQAGRRLKARTELKTELDQVAAFPGVLKEKCLRDEKPCIVPHSSGGLVRVSAVPPGRGRAAEFAAYRRAALRRTMAYPQARLGVRVIPIGFPPLPCSGLPSACLFSRYLHRTSRSPARFSSLWITVLTSSNGETVVLTCGITREKNASRTILRIKRDRGANTCSPFGSS